MVIANEEDYKVVCSLLEPILSDQFKKEIDSDTLRIIKEIKDNGEIKGDFLKSTPDDFDKLDTSNSFLAEKLKISQSTISRKCNKAIEQGLIVNEAPNGKPAIYSIIKDPNSLGRVLPRWTELQ